MKNIHRLLLLAGLVCLLAGSMSAVGADIAALDQTLKAAPSDVVAAGRRAAQCAEWEGKEISDAIGDSETLAALSRLKCDRLDADLAALRVKYAHAPQLLRALDAARTTAP